MYTKTKTFFGFKDAGTGSIRCDGSVVVGCSGSEEGSYLRLIDFCTQL